MRNSHVAVAFSLFAFASVATGCGGGGHGYGTSNDPIVITGNSLPNTLSGQLVNYCIPFEGGSGGPYVIDVIEGQLPHGVAPNNQTVCLQGQALEDGVFDFTLKLTDTGSQPFSTTTETYHWVIGIGSLVFATDPNLPAWIYNRFDAVALVLAGGVGPYSAEVIDDPANPTDELLPIGLAIPPDSTTIVGSPIGVKPGAAPFVYHVSVKARDHADDPSYPNPLTVTQVFTITVLIPPLVISTLNVPDGKCGASYSEKIEVFDGIPPFFHRIVRSLNSTTVISGDAFSVAKPASGLPGPLAKGLPNSAYEPDGSAPPYSARFPEGIYIREETGDIIGVPRRRGFFDGWVYWVQSKALPELADQNRWRAFSFTMADSAPPNVALSTAFLPAGQGFVAPNNLLGSWDLNQQKFVQFLATGGVVADGFCDAPHEGQRVAVPTSVETANRYDWSATTLVGTPTLATLGLSLTAAGNFGGTPVLRSGSRTLNLSVTDAQLPIPAGATHTATGQVRFDIGPDSVIVTESTAAHSNAAVAMGSFTLPAGSVNNVSYEYNNVTVEVWEPFASGSQIRTLANATDNALTQPIPAAPALTDLLTGIDMMGITVNPTWWAYDGYNINAKAARGMQHADPQRLAPGYTYGGDLLYNSSFYYYNMATSGSPDTYERAADAAVELPKVTGLATDVGTGVYSDGGQMYAFENATYFGVFIVRRDSRIYVPYAVNKAASGLAGFGDAVLSSDRTKSSAFRRPQFTVSPDGRFAAAKVKVSVDDFAEVATNEKIVIFSLTGEKPFAGGTNFRILTNGGTSGAYMYGSSFTLTNKHLYYLRGEHIGNTGDSRVMYANHYVYRATILSGDPALLTGPSPWTNTAGNPLAVPFQRWAAPSSPGLSSQYSSSWGPSAAVGNQNGGPVSGSKSPCDFYAFHWANFAENSSAPMPFRVSANGLACAILAGPGSGAGTAGSPGTTNFMNYDVFVDYDGAGTLRKATSVARRFMPPTRLAGLRAGEQLTKLHGWFTGPATQFEISDDGKTIAAVYNAYTAEWYADGLTNYSFDGSREDLLTLKGTGAAADPWSSTTATDVSSARFAGGVAWRFGSLAFTRDHNAVVFWGGCSLFVADYYWTYNAPSNPYSIYAGHFSGSLYAYTISSAKCENILPNADGGSVDGVKTLTAATTALGGAVPADWSGDQGALMPTGYFLSNDGNFYWMETMGALSATSGSTTARLVGVNVKHSDPTSAPNTINSRAPIRGFAPTWPAGRGWGPGGGWQSSPYVHATFSMVNCRASSRVGTHASVADTNGLVYYVSYYQDQVNFAAGNLMDYGTQFYGGGPAHPTAWDDGGRQSAELYAMETSTGAGPARISNLGTDSYSVYRYIRYIQPSRNGSNVAYITTTLAQYNELMTDRESLQAAAGVAFSAAGALSGSLSRFAMEAGTGRVGTSMSWDFTGNRLYYSFGASAANENGMSLVESTLNATGTGVANRRTQLGIGGTLARFSVLNSGR